MDIDINTLRGISTVFVMIGFIGVCFWAYSSKRREEFARAEQLPFADDMNVGESVLKDKTGGDKQ